MTARPRTLFVTGKLAEPALRRVLDELAPRAGFEPHVAVLPITVAALMTANWVARHLSAPPDLDRVVLPGFCRGDVEEVSQAAGAPAVLGPKDLRDLPEFFGKQSGPPPGYGTWDIEILAEINHAPRMTIDDILAVARHYRDGGAGSAACTGVSGTSSMIDVRKVAFATSSVCTKSPSDWIGNRRRNAVRYSLNALFTSASGTPNTHPTNVP